MRRKSLTSMIVIIFVLLSIVVIGQNVQQSNVQQEGISQGTVQELYQQRNILIVGTEGLSYDDNSGTATHTSGDYIDLSGQDLKVKSDSEGITLVVDANFNRNQIPKGKYTIEILPTANLYFNENNRIEALGLGNTVEFDSESNTITLTKGSILLNGRNVQSLGNTEVIIGSSSENGNYIYYENGKYVMRGTDFAFMYSNNQVIIPTIGSSGNSETIVYENLFSSDVTLKQNSVGEDALRLQTFLLTEGYAEVGSLDAFIGTKSVNALKDFQADQGLTQTGEMDDATRNRINEMSSYRIESDNCVVINLEGNHYITALTVSNGGINLTKNLMTSSIVESSSSMWVVNSEGDFGFEKFTDKGRTQMRGVGDTNTNVQNVASSQQTQTPPTNNEQLSDEQTDDYTYLQSLIGIPYGPKYPQGPDKDQKHLDCVSLVYEYASHEEVQLSGSRGDQIYARHTTPVTTINTNNRDVSSLQTGDIVFIGHSFSGGEGGISAYHLGVVGAPVTDNNGNVVDYTMIHASGGYGRNVATDYHGSVKEVSLLQYQESFKNNDRRNTMFIGRLNE